MNTARGAHDAVAASVFATLVIASLRGLRPHLHLQRGERGLHSRQARRHLLLLPPHGGAAGLRRRLPRCQCQAVQLQPQLPRQRGACMRQNAGGRAVSADITSLRASPVQMADGCL